MHTLPEILTVMDLMTIYATDSQTNPDQQRRTREAGGHSEFILRETFAGSSMQVHATTMLTYP